MSKYKDIIDLDHYELRYHNRMSIENRAAQFSPFAALTGYSESIKETSRLTKEEIELSEDMKSNIDMKLQYIEEHIKEKPEIEVLYFKKDNKKKGGEYYKYKGNVKRIDTFNKVIIFNDMKINLNNIYDIKII